MELSPLFAASSDLQPHGWTDLPQTESLVLEDSYAADSTSESSGSEGGYTCDLDREELNEEMDCSSNLSPTYSDAFLRARTLPHRLWDNLPGVRLVRRNHRDCYMVSIDLSQGILQDIEKTAGLFNALQKEGSRAMKKIAITGGSETQIAEFLGDISGSWKAISQHTFNQLRIDPLRLESGGRKLVSALRQMRTYSTGEGAVFTKSHPLDIVVDASIWTGCCLSKKDLPKDSEGLSFCFTHAHHCSVM